MNPTFLAVALLSLAISGQVRAELRREGSDAVLSDKPRCRFAWPDWDYTNITNPLILTKSTLDQSMIGIMRIPAGRTLPQGKTKVAAGMTGKQITSLLRENLQGRGHKVEGMAFVPAKIAGTEAVQVRYAQRGTPTKRGVEYGFVRDGFFFYLLFVAVEGPHFANQQKDFERVASTFRVLQ